MVQGREVPFGGFGPIPDPKSFAAGIQALGGPPLDAVVTQGDELRTWSDHLKGLDPDAPRWIGDCYYDPKTWTFNRFKRS